VDFRTTRGVFEALSAPSFAQRLGRFGRHRPGSVAFVTTDARVADAILSLPARCERDRLLECAKLALPVDDELDGFACSGWASLVLGATFGALRTRFAGQSDELARRLDVIEAALRSRLGLGAIPAEMRELVSRRVESALANGVGFRGGIGSVEVFDVRERSRRGDPDAASYEVDIPTFLRRASWERWRPGRPPVVTGWSARRTLSLRATGVDTTRAAIHAPPGSAIELRLDNAPTEAESLLRGRAQNIVGLFPKHLRGQLSWREVVYDAGDQQIALLEDDAIVGGYLLTRDWRG
jgi:hypothetical protein